MHLASTLSTFDDLYSFIATCRPLHAAWRAHESSIALAVLKRDEDSSQEAEDLVSTQLTLQPYSRMTTTERLARNVRSVRIASDIFLAEVVGENMITRFRKPFMTDAEKKRFSSAFYGVWISMCLGQQSGPGKTNNDGETSYRSQEQFLSSQTLRYMRHLFELALWMPHYLMQESRERILKSMSRSSGVTVDELARALVNAWTAIEKSFDEKYQRLRGDLGFHIPDTAPISICAFFDDFQEAVDLLPEKV